ncbi:MAG: carbohydrate kinase family protein [Anaerolineae bacterium]
MGETRDGEPRVVVVGAACVDTKGQTLAAMVPGTSNPGEIRIGVGGVGRNIAEALGRLGLQVSLISAVGDDDWGRDILRRTRRGGVDVHHVHICSGERSAAYLAVMDDHGERLVSVDNTGILRHIDAAYLMKRQRLFSQADMVVVDGNVAEESLQALFWMAERYGFRTALDPASAVLAQRLQKHMSRFYLITPDVAEAEVLSGVRIQSDRDAVLAAQAMVAAGVRMAIVTMAEQGCVYATSETSGRIPAIRSEVVDRIGAGDALAAAVVFGLVNEFPVDEAVRLGVAAAALTLRCSESVCPQLSLQALYDAMAP